MAPPPTFGATGPFDVTLDATTPSVTVSVQALLNSSDPIAAGSGEIGLEVSMGETAEGSLRFSLASQNEQNESDILEPQSQGSTRIAINAFDGCGAGDCTEDLTLQFDRTDDALEGVLPLSWTLDGLASTDTTEEAPGSGTLDFQVN